MSLAPPAERVATRDDPESTPPSRRVIRRDRPLPSGRAVVGAVLVTIAALGTLALATGGDDGPTTTYLVTTHDVTAGSPIGPGDVHLEAMTLSPDLASAVLNSTDGLDGAVALTDLRSGSLLHPDDLIAAAQASDGPLLGYHEVSFAVPLTRTPPAVRAGDRITLLATAGEETTVAVEDAPVLSLASPTDRIAAGNTAVLTLAVTDPAIVVELAHLTQVADLTVVRSTRALDDDFTGLRVGPPEATS